MIKVLIVDDNAGKLRRIKEAVLECPGVRRDCLVTAADCVNARRELEAHQFDLLILDLLLPERFGDDEIKSAGVDLLRECSAGELLNRPFHIIGITQYEDLKAEFASSFDDELWALVTYDEGSVQWKHKIQNKIKYLLHSKLEMYTQFNKEYIYDVAFITALHEPELQSVLDLEWNFQKASFSGDPTTYYDGIFEGNNKKLKVIAASSTQMGMTAASSLAMKMIHRFRPRYIIMVGISAGIKGSAELGDILVADTSWDYGSGKIKCTKDGETEFQADPRHLPIDTTLKDLFATAKMERVFLDQIRNSWRGEKPLNALELRMGPLASGAAVVQDKSLVEEIKTQQRKIIGIEMEGYGVFYAATNAAEPRPKPIIIKSVCDFADQFKEDKFQSYAAYTSAQYAYHFCLSFL